MAEPKDVSAGRVVEQVLNAAEPERRLRGVTLTTRLSTGGQVVNVDEQLLVTAFSSLLLASVALAEDGSEAVVAASAEPKTAELVFRIALDRTRVPVEVVPPDVLVLAATEILDAVGGRVLVNGSGQGAVFQATLPYGRPFVTTA